MDDEITVEDIKANMAAFGFDLSPEFRAAYERGLAQVARQYEEKLAADMGMSVDEFKVWEREFWSAGDRLAESMRERRRERVARSGLRLVKG